MGSNIDGEDLGSRDELDVFLNLLLPVLCRLCLRVLPLVFPVEQSLVKVTALKFFLRATRWILLRKSETIAFCIWVLVG